MGTLEQVTEYLKKNKLERLDTAQIQRRFRSFENLLSLLFWILAYFSSVLQSTAYEQLLLRDNETLLTGRGKYRKYPRKENSSI